MQWTLNLQQLSLRNRIQIYKIIFLKDIKFENSCGNIQILEIGTSEQLKREKGKKSTLFLWRLKANYNMQLEF